MEAQRTICQRCGFKPRRGHFYFEETEDEIPRACPLVHVEEIDEEEDEDEEADEEEDEDEEAK